MKTIRKVLGSLLLLSSFALLPALASAHTLQANAATAVSVAPSGVVRVIGAEVTSVSGNVVNAITTFGSTVLHWIVGTTMTTKIYANSSTTASTTAIHVGDRINFVGSASSSSTPFTVVATKIRDLTTFHRVEKDKDDKKNKAELHARALLHLRADKDD